MPEAEAYLAPALALLAYALPESSPEAWAAKTSVLAAMLVLLAGWRVVTAGAAARSLAGESLPWLAVAGWMALSAGWSGYPARSLFQAVAAGALALLAATGTGASAPAMAAILLGAGAWEILSATLFAGSSPAGAVRAAGSFVDADHFAACLAMGMGWVFAQVQARARPGPLLWSLVLAGFAWAGAASASRAFLLAAGAVAVAGWWLAPRGGSARGWWTAVVATGAGMGAAPPLAARLAGQAAGREPFAWARLDLWRTAAMILRRAPVGGTGLGTFGEGFAAMKPAAFAAFASDFAHSDPLQLACETGVVGLGLALWGCTAVAARGATARGLESPRAGLVLAVVAFGIFALVDFPCHVPALALPGVLTLLAIRRFPSRPAQAPRRTAMVWAVCGAVALWLLSAGAAEWCYAGGVRLALGADPAGARACFVTALQVSPEHAGAMTGLAELNPDEADAVPLAVRAGRLRPGWIDPARTAFQLALRRHEPEAAAAAVHHAQALEPFGLETRLMEVRWDEEQGDLASAARRLAALESVWPMQLDVWYAKAELAERRGRRGEARRLLRHIVRIYPSAEFAAEWLGRLGP